MLALTWDPYCIQCPCLRFSAEVGRGEAGGRAPTDHGKLAGDEWTLGSPCDLGVPVSFTCLFLPHGSSGHSHLP